MGIRNVFAFATGCLLIAACSINSATAALIPTETNDPALTATAIQIQTSTALWAEIANAHATNVVLATQDQATRAARAAQATLTATYAVRAIPTVDLTQYWGWKTYRNDQFGFSFEYPTYYDAPGMSACAPQANTSSPNTIYVGVHVEIIVLDNPNDLALEAYVKQLLSDHPDWLSPTQESAEIAGYHALHVQYGYGELNRTSEITFVARNSLVYAIQLYWGRGSCDSILGEGAPEDDSGLYFQMLKTFRFIPK